MEIIFELHAHYPNKFCAARAYSYDDNEIGVVKSKMIYTNHHFCVALSHERVMENHGKIMEFDCRKLVGTLDIVPWGCKGPM